MPKNVASFRTITHIPGIGYVEGERGEFEIAAENAYDVVLQALQEPMTAYAVARAPEELQGAELDDAIIQLQLKYVRMVLQKVVSDNLE